MRDKLPLVLQLTNFKIIIDLEEASNVSTDLVKRPRLLDSFPSPSDILATRPSLLDSIARTIRVSVKRNAIIHESLLDDLSRLSPRFICHLSPFDRVSIRVSCTATRLELHSRPESLDREKSKKRVHDESREREKEERDAFERIWSRESQSRFKGSNERRYFILEA